MSRFRTSAAPWIALTPRQLRAECARFAAGADLDAQRALAAGLDAGVRRLHQDREVGREQVGVGLPQQPQPVVERLDLLGLVEHVGDVVDRLGHGRGELEDDRVAALHVAGAEAVQDARLHVVPAREVGVDRDRVEVAGR